MNILVLNGSPRPGGNTSALVKAFKEGAEGSGHTVNVCPVGTMKIGGCKACEYCHTKGEGKCIQKDDMEKILEASETADMLVLASPVYYWSWSGQLQCAVSRFYPYGPFPIKKFALILSSASPDVYDAPISQYRSIIDYSDGEDLGIFAFDGDVKDSEEVLDKVRKFGASL